ncbi:MAG TPA: imidazole glycerol phosphate synthase subunit HisH [Anaerolineales bacterium]|nr:imidazole glycerol phosphate synthase subunit HisH [Anaerolineales bacterium]
MTRVTDGDPKVAIVDFGLGNLYSVHQACRKVGLDAEITSSRQAILNADAVILPGVGAYRDAMQNLRKLDLVGVLRDIAASNKPLLGVCLGMQLLMSESFEFGHHEGLDIIKGSVVHFGKPNEEERTLKVPQIGWNRIHKSEQSVEWRTSLLAGVPDQAYMYFVHSYIVQPEDQNMVLSTTRYGDVEFCSSLQKGTVFACQFHPERSSQWGIAIYQNLAAYFDQAI